MAELEHELRSLAAAIEWPPTPPLELPSRAAAAAAGAAARRRAGRAGARARRCASASRRRVARSCGSSISAASPSSASTRCRRRRSGRSPPTSACRSTRAPHSSTLGVPMRLPKLDRAPQLYQQGLAVSALLARPEPVLLTELRSAAGRSSRRSSRAGRPLVSVQVGKRSGCGSPGQPHVYVPSRCRRGSPATCCSGRSARSRSGSRAGSWQARRARPRARDHGNLSAAPV